jgi:hypothetical protein
MAMTLDGSLGVTFNDASLQGAAASPFGLKNRLINADMRIDQRNAGAAVTLPDGAAGFAFPVDRWLASRANVATATAQQSSDVPTGQGFVNSFVVTNGTASTSGSTAEGYIGHIIEGFNIADLGWGTASAKTVTLSFWVKSSITGTHSGSLFNSAATQAYPFSYSISTANTWEQKTITVAGSTSGTWLTTNGRGLFIAFNNGTGSSYLGTANAWTGSIKYGVTGSVALNSVTGSTWYVTGVQLEVGSTATPFERRMYGTELALCQRYYWKIASGASSTNNIAQAFMLNTTVLLVYLQHPVYMRTGPSLVQTTGTNYYCFERSVDQDFFDSFTIASPTERISILVNSTQVSGTTGISGNCYSNNASASLALSAEL